MRCLDTVVMAFHLSIEMGYNAVLLPDMNNPFHLCTELKCMEHRKTL